MTSTNPFRQESIKIPCPACGHTFPEQISRLEESPALACPECHASIQIDGAELHQEMVQLDTELERAEQACE
jgi:hypothetical protein